MTAALCSHCLLLLGRSRHDAEVAGEAHNFCCYGCCLAFQVAHGENEEADAAWLLIRLGTGAFLSMNIMLFSLLLYADGPENAEGNTRAVVHWALFLLAAPTVILLGGPFLREACREAARLRLGSSALVVLGVGAAFAYSVLAMATGGERVYFDTATMVLVLFTLGRYLEAAGRARAMRSLAPMLAPEREWVTWLEGGVQRRVPVRDIRAGMCVLVKPGERIGVDGVIVDGVSHVGEAILTGESSPVGKHPGDAVLAGSINHEGPLLVVALGNGVASRWAGIARAVRDALAARSQVERLAERIAGAFVPMVLGLAAVTVFYWAGRGPFGAALLCGLAVLVVACPCALGLAAPLATSIGIASLARRGCLVRGGDVLESLGALRVVAFDKTGTLTLGEPRLDGIATQGLPPNVVLGLAAALAACSEHPLAKGIVLAAQMRRLQPPIARNIRSVPGRGIAGEVDGSQAALGALSWLAECGFTLPPELAACTAERDAGTVSLTWVGQGSAVVGVLSLDDPLRPDARQIVTAIRGLGMETVLVSGDRAISAQRVADAVGIRRVESSMSPEAKRAFVAQGGRRWAMVGDGLNDAPVLAAAGVGIAVGSATDLAREAAGLVLPDGGLAMLPWAIRLSRAVRRTVVVNLVWAFGYNAAALALAASGHLLPVAAAALMAGSSLIVVLNSLRLERFQANFPAPGTLSATGDALAAASPAPAGIRT